eukprot:665715_1
MLPWQELLDIFYYKSSLEPVLVRTFLRHCIFDLESYHTSGLVHGYIRPEHMLLDSTFNVNLYFDEDRNQSRNKQYEAPELIPDRIGYQFSFNSTKNSRWMFFLGGYYRSDKTDYKNNHRVLSVMPIEICEICYSYYGDVNYKPCDIFALGIIFFILLTGYPPFENAVASDRWFRPLIKGNYSKFWSYHKDCAIANDAQCKNLLQQMLCYDYRTRIILPQIKQHPWFNSTYLRKHQLVPKLKEIHRKMDKQITQKRSNPYSFLGESCFRYLEKGNNARLWPSFLPESVLSNAYTHTTPKRFFGLLHELVANQYHGVATYDDENCAMHCKVRIMEKHKAKRKDRSNGFHFQDYEFDVMMFISRVYAELQEAKPHLVDKERVYVAVIRRIKGDALKFCSIRTKILQERDIFSGLPGWVVFRFYEEDY